MTRTHIAVTNGLKPRSSAATKYLCGGTFYKGTILLGKRSELDSPHARQDPKRKKLKARQNTYPQQLINIGHIIHDALSSSSSSSLSKKARSVAEGVMYVPHAGPEERRDQ